MHRIVKLRRGAADNYNTCCSDFASGSNFAANVFWWQFICPRAQKPSRGILCVLGVCVKRKTDAAVDCLRQTLRAASNVSLRYCQAAVLVKLARNLYVIAGVFINLLTGEFSEAVR